MSLPYIFLNGDIRPFEEALILTSDLAMHRGYGVFDYFTYEQGHNQYLNDYLDRLYSSIHLAHLSIPWSRVQLIEHLDKLYKINNTPLCNMKVIVTAGYSDDGYAATGISNVIILSYEKKSNLNIDGLEGYRLITCEYQRAWPEIKSTDYFCSAILMPKMKKEGAIDVLYHDRNEVRETSRANIFIVKDHQVFTPAEKVLKGITRKRVLSLSSPWPVTTKSISKEELMAADEVFITSTTKSIMPITHIDNIMIGNGEVGLVTTRLSQLM